MSESFLNPDKKKSVNWDKTENIFIEGDNLDVLKVLQKTYCEKIRVIYIDPPYNTGKNFVYNDTHKDWQDMVAPRLEIAQKLLTKDGVIFISIDENEVCNLRIVCDKIFGKENYITTFIWEKTQHFGRQKLNAYSNAEYIVCYAKELYNNKIKELLVEKISFDMLDAPLFNASNRITEITFPKHTVKFNLPDGIYKKTTSDLYELLSQVKVANGKNANDFILRFRSRWSAEKVLTEIKKGTTFHVKTEAFAVRAVYPEGKYTKIAPKQMIFTNPKNVHCTYSRFGERVTTNETAKSELRKILGGDIFDYPKPLSLISYLLSMIFNESEDTFAKEFTVLDFFSGSGTTAHACMHLNSLDGGKRKFIMVQKPELIKNPDKKFKTLCDIGQERIKIAGLEIAKKYDSVDTGFRVYKLD